MAGLQSPTVLQQRRHFSLSSASGGTDHQSRPQEHRRTTTTSISLSSFSTQSTKVTSPVTLGNNPNDAGKTSGWLRGSYYQTVDMWTAVASKDSAALHKCLKAGLNVNCCRWQKAEAIHPPGARCLADIAASKNDIKSMRLLLEYAADLSGGSTAAFAHHTRAQRNFIIPPEEREIVERNTWSTPLHRACRFGFEEMIQILLQEGHVDPNARDSSQRTSLHLAVIGRHTKVAKLLLAAGALVDLSDNEGVTPLMAAALSAHKELVEIFLDHGAIINAANQRGETSFYLSCVEHHLNVMTVLVARGATPDVRTTQGMSAFFKAASSLKLETMNTLIQYGADVDCPDLNGCTALLRAIMAKNIFLIKHLLHLGADVDLEDDDRWTPLFAAMIHNDESVIRLLLVNGCSINKTDAYGNTALHLAAMLGSTMVVRHILMTRSAPRTDHSVMNMFGQTPLMLAAKHGHSAIVKILLKHGASLSYVDSNGYKALDGAMYWGSHACVRLLMEAGAEFDNSAFLALQQGRQENPNADYYDMILSRLRSQHNISWNPNLVSHAHLRASLARTIIVENVVARMREKQGKPPVDEVAVKPAAGKDVADEEAESPDPFEACIPKLPPSLIINNSTTNIKAGGGINAVEATAVTTNLALGIAGLVLGA